MKVKAKIVPIVMVLLMLCSATSRVDANNWYSEYWQRMQWTTFHYGPWTSRIYAEYRTQNHMQNCRFLLLSEQLAYNVSPHFRLEAHYTYFHRRAVQPKSPWKWEHRFEFEGNRDFDLPKNAKILTRNRFEIKQEQHNLERQYRFRQRAQLMIPMEGWGTLTAYSIINEVFYDFNTHEIFEDRLTPINLTFQIHKDCTLDVFFLFQFYMRSTNQAKVATLGSQFTF